MQTRRYHHGDLRAALLARAEQTLRERGPEAVTLRQLARDLCVSHAAPSRHFKDKRALMDALALIGFDRLHETAVAARTTAGDSFADRLRALARAYVGFATANGELLNVMYAVKHDPDASDALVAAGHRLAALAIGSVVDGQRAGDVREGPAERIGLPVFASVHGFADLAATGMLSADEIESGLDDVVAYLLRGCAP